MAELKVPGISVAVFDHSEIIWAKAWGLRDVDRAQAVGTGTLFQAASISKPVSAVGMFRLVEQGRLEIDRDVNLIQTVWKVPSFEPRPRPSHYATSSATCPDLVSTDSVAILLARHCHLSSRFWTVCGPPILLRCAPRRDQGNAKSTQAGALCSCSSLCRRSQAAVLTS